MHRRGGPYSRAVEPDSRLPLLALVACVLVWGTTFVVSADALEQSSPAVLTVARFAVAAAVLVPLELAAGGLGRVLLRPSTAVLGLTGVTAYYGLQNVGLGYTTAGNAALLQAVLPIATAVLGWGLLAERPTAWAAGGLVLATVGVVLLAGPAVAALDRGSLLILVGVLSYALYTVRLRLHGAERAVVVAAATCLWGLLLLLPWQLWELASGRADFGGSASLLGAVLYLGVGASALTLLLWTWATPRLPASTAGVFPAAIPAVGYAAAVLAGEGWDLRRTVGCVLALVGTVVVVRSGAATTTVLAAPSLAAVDVQDRDAA